MFQESWMLSFGRVGRSLGGSNNDPDDVHRNCGGTCTWHWFGEFGIRTEIDSGVLS